MSTHGAGVGVGSVVGKQLKVQGIEVLPMVVDLEGLILVPQPNDRQVQFGNSEERQLRRAGLRTAAVTILHKRYKLNRQWKQEHTHTHTASFKYMKRTFTR